MTLLHFTLGALPYRDPSKGTHIIHAYLHQSEPTRTDNPGDERRAAKDCAVIVGDQRKFAPVYALGAELYNYTFEVLKKRERADRKKAGAEKYKWDVQTLMHGRRAFCEFCTNVKRVHAAWQINRRRFDCQNLRKVEARKFRKAMRKAAMFGKPHDKRKTKRCGMGRP